MDMVPLKESSIISFAPGNCGSFLQWCLNFISDLEFSEQLPFGLDGNSHEYFIPRINSFVMPTKEEITGALDDERYDQKTFTQYTEYWEKNQRSSNSRNLFKEGNFEEFEVLIKVYNKDANLVAKMISLWRNEFSKKLNKDIGEIKTSLSERILEKILLEVKENKIEIGDVKEVMSRIVEGKIFEDAIKIEKLDDNKIEEEIRKIVKEKPGMRPNAYMGLVMAKFKGKVDAKKAMEILNRIFSNSNS